ncbi:hypothetical protein THAOC_33596 [Thalassiosira oceanica]|uniref:Cation efflux protein transmembrane domain-containing protein n=1 Tax=Thalassiosira oceanica TaxID=159749 RepID=K0R3W3_THAOC|nr:hypothetical protein THAOC_33596 [Thalassiosira oceanica]|mmetsp:Transcript_389/g.826  ORF Transcript_389/g.826 Transcript_389/m.826 type:complete len:257 (+) Transcript_389:238-1008(+)|eukprot:EJK47668.1 hypothetical protein THAOC_33596 [Thalassiosira oceanica]
MFRFWTSPTARDAFILSWISLVCTLVAAIGGVVGFTKTESTLIMAFGLENFVDFTSSAIVIWRFYCPSEPDDALLAKLKKREERASVAISLVIALLGVFVFAIGIYDLMEKDEDTDLVLLLRVSFASIIVFGVLTMIKFKYAKDLDSASLHKDGVCSLIGTSLSLSLFITTAIIERVPNAWYIDPVVSLLVGVSAVVYGSKSVGKRVAAGVPIYQIDWWWQPKDEVSSSQELPETTKGGDYVASPEKGADAEHEII